MDLPGATTLSELKEVEARPERDAANRPIHLAATYADDGTIALYREGKPLGSPYKTDGPAMFEAGQAHLIFGLRHGTERRQPDACRHDRPRPDV